MMRSKCGWRGSLREFASVSPEGWLTSLESHHKLSMNAAADRAQLTAWEECFAVMQDASASLLSISPETADWSLVFEYELPRERGRRPDVVVLMGNRLTVLEFKAFDTILQAHVDQTAAYARDLAHYHAATHNVPVLPCLVLTRWRDNVTRQEEVTVISGVRVADTLLAFAADTVAGAAIDPAEWLAADYAPLPSLVAAARTIFEHEPLPAIRRAASARIPQTIETLVGIAREAQTKGERHLALVTGVPGAGKTLVGIQFVYTNHFGDTGAQRTAVLLSGNGPLVLVLQHALHNTIFVQDVHGFLKEYGGPHGRTPAEHIWVYDEAQRAWDAGRVKEKRGHNASEPEDFLRIGERMPGWALMVGLIGEGQEIHLGEEAGLGQWNEALRKMTQPWTVHCPEKLKTTFTAASAVQTSDLLDLVVAMRFHLADDVHAWASALLDSKIDKASQASERARSHGFDLYVTRDLKTATDYVVERYRGHDDKRFGLLASSKAKNLERHGIRNGYSDTRLMGRQPGPWYNDPPTSRYSCCQLRDVATEFACQGLELDFPIVGWGDDLCWEVGKWRPKPQPRSGAQDPDKLRLNSYRVLLTRGRDGLAIFVPEQPSLDQAFETIQASGAQVLA